MSKCELRERLLRLLPHANGQKQVTALFTVVLLLRMTHAEFDVPHIHIESVPIQPTTVVMAAMGTPSVSRFPLTYFNGLAAIAEDRRNCF
jgi:hypothetical protein